ncbi:MAG: proteasome subunit beta [Nitrospira sp.]|nr:proteasome subunit beta [Nitrospira sp.]
MEWMGSHRFIGQCSSFFDFLQQAKPELTPAARWGAGAPPSIPAQVPADEIQRHVLTHLSHGTTVLAIKYDRGAVIVGDRRAVEGYQVAARRLEKVFTTDSHSAIAIAGAAGPCLEMARLFRIELEHYEKLDGVLLSCEGKANRLGHMVKANWPMVMQGLVVIPLFVGFDVKQNRGRIFKYDVTGGKYEETDYHAVGSGGKDARVTMKERFRKTLSEQDAVSLALEALLSAAEEDVGTGGPDVFRGIYPTVKCLNALGVADVDDDEVARQCNRLVRSRSERET